MHRRYLTALDRVFAQENLFTDTSAANPSRPNGAPAATYWLNQDRLGTVRTVTDNFFVAWNRAQYDPFGNRVALEYIHNGTALATSITRFGFTGQEYDEVTGLTWYSNGHGDGNWMDHRTNTWIKRDSLPVRALNPNAYVYCANGPTNFTDPNGQEPSSNGLSDTYRRWDQLRGQIMTFITTGGYWPDADQASGSAFEAEVLRGLRTGGKAVVNGLAIAVVKTLTLGTCGDGLELIGVTEEDRALGYDTAVQFATASGEIFIGVASGNAAAVLQNGGRLARTASGALNILDAAGNVVGVVKGTYDAATNGINLGNGVQVFGSALGLAGNAKPLVKGADDAKAVEPSHPNASCAALPAPTRTRLPQDIGVNPVAPPAKRTGTIGRNPAQYRALQADINSAIAEGATDIRVNQHQVDASGRRVGVNMPDLQYTRPDGTRIYIEYDSSTAGTFPNSPRGPAHAERILANDPSGIVLNKVIN